MQYFVDGKSILSTNVPAI